MDKFNIDYDIMAVIYDTLNAVVEREREREQDLFICLTLRFYLCSYGPRFPVLFVESRKKKKRRSI